MRKQKLHDQMEPYMFTHDEIDMISECIKRTEDYYTGLLMLKEDWNPEKNEKEIPIIKATIRMLQDLQKRTTYIGQSDYYKNL